MLGNSPILKYFYCQVLKINYLPPTSHLHPPTDLRLYFLLHPYQPPTAALCPFVFINWQISAEYIYVLSFLWYVIIFICQVLKYLPLPFLLSLPPWPHLFSIHVFGFIIIIAISCSKTEHFITHYPCVGLSMIGNTSRCLQLFCWRSFQKVFKRLSRDFFSSSFIFYFILLTLFFCLVSFLLVLSRFYPFSLY